jgi:hypothetical protein
MPLPKLFLHFATYKISTAHVTMRGRLIGAVELGALQAKMKTTPL